MNEYEIVFTKKCLAKMNQIESMPHIDEALGAVYNGLRNNPYAFDSAPPIAEIRYAKTKFYMREGLYVPSLTILFMIKEDDKVVKILDIWTNPSFDNLDP